MIEYREIKNQKQFLALCDNLVINHDTFYYHRQIISRYLAQHHCAPEVAFMVYRPFRDFLYDTNQGNRYAIHFLNTVEILTRLVEIAPNDENMCADIYNHLIKVLDILETRGTKDRYSMVKVEQLRKILLYSPGVQKPILEKLGVSDLPADWIAELV
jgi:hypothetical protein